MKWLCICQYGHSRSVALVRVLHAKKEEAVAVGCGTTPGVIPLLANWADVIVTLQPDFNLYVPESARAKLVCFDVGVDQWSNPYSPALVAIVAEKLESYLRTRPDLAHLRRNYTPHTSEGTDR